MTIKTKFKIHDEVWAVWEGKARSMKIEAITYRSEWDDFGERIDTTLNYTLIADMAERPKFEEGWVFATREELIASL